MSEKQLVILDDFSPMGGFHDDEDIEVVNASWVMWTHDEKTNEPTPRLSLELADGDPIYLSTWNNDSWEPDEDGQFIRCTGSKTRFHPDSPVAVFLQSLQNAGFELKKLLTEGASALNGYVLHVIQVPAKEFGDAKKNKDGKEIKRTNTSVERIVSEPGKKGGKGTKAGKSSAAAKKTAANDMPDGDVKTLADQVVLTVLTEEGGSCAHGTLGTKAFKLANVEDKKLAPAVFGLVKDVDYISASEMWSYDAASKVVTLA